MVFLTGYGRPQGAPTTSAIIFGLKGNVNCEGGKFVWDFLTT